jgi:hypothetical protein
MERAFALANSGRYVNLTQIKARLSAEGYWPDAVTGPQLRSQLKVLIEAARTVHRP